MDMGEASIGFEGVSFGYGQRRVLEDISIALPARGVTVVLGKSGSGKSTLLELINGMNVPDRGVVRVFGNALDYRNMEQHRRQTGYVVQRFGLFPHMTVGENIGLPGVLQKMPKAQVQARVVELMRKVRLPESLLPRYPYELSGGEQQRVGLCRALLLDPPLLLMDEPFASLDYATKHSIYTYFRELQRAEPRTVVLVTHDWDEARLLADHVVWVEGGRIRHHGAAGDLEIIGEAYRNDA
jgi:osmoprotectant transport system ATP-binding protein